LSSTWVKRGGGADCAKAGVVRQVVARRAQKPIARIADVVIPGSPYLIATRKLALRKKSAVDH